MGLRAYECPNLRRWVIVNRRIPTKNACVPCLFAPPLTKVSAELAVKRSEVPLVAFECRNGLGWHTRRVGP